MRPPFWMRQEIAEPMDCETVKPSIHHDHLKPSGERATKAIERTDYVLRVAARFKALWVRELMNRHAGHREAYSAGEMAAAEKEAGFWSVDDDGRGNLTAERQS
jgi:hypothetical protein